MLTNYTNKVLYIGVTNNLKRRLYEHKHGLLEGFTKRYRVHKLVYYEAYQNIADAILREKRLKGLLRIRKNALIKTVNPQWTDLAPKLFPDTFAETDSSLRSE